MTADPPPSLLDVMLDRAISGQPVTLVVKQPYVIGFPQPAPTLNMNRQLHWAKKAELVKAWRHAAHIACRNAANKGVIPRGLPFVVVQLELPVRSLSIRRDPSNWAPTVKACVDGMVDAGIVVDDDSTHVATVEPRFVKGDVVRLLITPSEAPS